MRNVALLTLIALTTSLGSTPTAARAKEPPLSWAFGITLPASKNPAPKLDRAKTFSSLLGPLQKMPVFQDIAWIKVAGFGEPSPENLQVLIHIHLRNDAAVKDLVRKLDRSPENTWEHIAGLAVLRRDFSRSEKKLAESYMAFPAPSHLVICTNRDAVERLAGLAVETYLAGPADGELVSVELHPPALKTRKKESELLGMIKGELDIKIVEAPGELHLEGAAELTDLRSANRARRLVEGLVTALALEVETDPKDPLDERLALTTEGNKLGARIKLRWDEVETLLESFRDDFEAGISGLFEK